ncbi:MAG: cyclic nucleotide-binding domain-containing protein [Deltaproteobacteria bacterium]|nr:cyclic nucleotide-binding domain-containing protein [Deltaproteobacteria bacterium]
MNQPSTRALTEKLNHALHRERWASAFELYGQLRQLERDEPRWPNRQGDLHRRLGQDGDAVRCYEHAVDLYAAQGFVARAAAMAKVLLAIDPTRLDVLARVKPTRARELMELKRRAARMRSADGGRGSIVDAPLLAATAGGDTDTLEFEDLDPELIIELDLSDTEIVGRPPPPPPARRPPTRVDHELSPDSPVDWDVLFVEEDAGPSAEELAALPSSPLFAAVPAAALEELLVAAELVEASPGDLVLRLGQPADALLVITEGSVEVLVPGLDHGPSILLGEGDVVGEACLLDDVTRRANVVARSALRALSLPKDTLDQLVREHPAVGIVLTELLGRRLLGNLLATSELFSAFDANSKRLLSRLFEVRRAESDTALLVRNKRSDGLYVVLAGRLCTRSETGHVATVVAGGIVGERSLLDHAPSKFDCWAATDVLLLRLPRSRFLELCASYPPVLASLAELASREVAPESSPLV